MGCGCGPGSTCDDMDDEMPSEADLARFGDDYGITCQECGEELYEDAAVCPQCGAFQVEAYRNELAGQAEGFGWPSLSRLIIPVVIVLLVLVFALWR